MQAADQHLTLALQPGIGQHLRTHKTVLSQALAQVRSGPSRRSWSNFALHGTLDLQLGTRPQPFGCQFSGPVAHPFGDVVTGDDEVFAGVVLPSQDDVRVRIVGVPVIHRHPVQPCSPRSASMRAIRCRV